MKILYHHRVRSKDGQSVHIDEIITALNRLGHQVEVCAPSSYEDEEFGGESKSLNLLKKSLPKVLYEVLELCYAVIDMYKLSIAVFRFKPDFIYERYNLFLPSGIWVKKIFSIPLLLEVNAPLYQERSQYGGISLKSLAQWTEKYAWRNADHVFVVTEVLANYIRRINVPEKRITVTPNGVNLENFELNIDKKNLKRELGFDNCILLGFVGFVREWHGLDNVINLIADNTDKKCVLYIIGDGPGKARLEYLANKKKVSNQVIFKGIVERNEIVKYISSFDIALQPDVVEYASPLKLFEYMICACSIIAPDTPNIREVLKDEENALLCNPSDFTEFTSALKKLTEDRQLRAKLGKNAYQTIISTPYTWTYNAERVIDIAKKLISNV